MTPARYLGLLLFIAGMGGFLYGYDLGIIGAALLYLNKTVPLTVAQESLVVAAVLAGGTVSSLVAGALADVIGRKRLMVTAAVLFLASVALIVVARGFGPLFAGRTLQGLSAGMIAVVIPLYLAEALPAAIRGRGTAAFQLFLTVGILIALAVGRHHAAGVEAAVAAQATWVTAVNVVCTVRGLMLMDRIGRKALLQLGTGTLALALLAGAVVFWRLESGAWAAGPATGRGMTGCLLVFVAGFAAGPGVCVWLALSELMPMRIRSLGMGLGLLVNQGISTVIAALFLPVVQRHGYAVMFAAWAACPVGYFLVTTRWLPETRGRTLEEIEAEFAR